MTLPIQALLPVVTQVASLMQCQAEAQTNRHRDTVSLLVAAQKVKLEIAALKHQAEIKAHQRAILERIIDAAENLNRSKIDAIMEMFREVMGILREHQSALISEKQQLSAQFHSAGTSATTRMLIRKRQREVDAALTEIDQAALQVQAGATGTLTTLDPNIKPQLLSW